MVTSSDSSGLSTWLRSALEQTNEPLYVGIDGRSGAGKSTLAEEIASELGPNTVAVIEGDQFYSGGTGQTWDTRSVEQRAANVMDWRRQLTVLTELRTSGSARWHPFDWEADDWDSDTARLSNTVVATKSAPLVILEGAYSCRPELHDALDQLILLNPSEEIRRKQLLSREGDAYRTEWERRWSSAEDHYFGSIMTESRFDLVIGENNQI